MIAWCARSRSSHRTSPSRALSSVDDSISENRIGDGHIHELYQPITGGGKWAHNDLTITAKAPAAAAARRLTSWADPVRGDTVTGQVAIDRAAGTFPELLAAATSLRGLLAPSRALSVTDLSRATATAGPPAASDIAALVARVQAVEKLVRSRADALTKVAGGTDAAAARRLGARRGVGHA
jgi:hypothetical protein